MNGSPVRIPRRAIVVLALALATSAVASCHIEEPFARNNHWDKDSDATKTLVGPDSTFSIGDRIRVTLTGDPPFPDGPLQVEWISNGTADTATQVFAAGAGEFVVSRANAGYARIAVAAKFDEVVVVWEVWVGQLVASLDFFCGAGAGLPCEATPVPLGTNLTIRTDMRDANGNGIRRRDEAMRRAVTVSRDPDIASTVPVLPNAAGNWVVSARAPGSTWIVVTMDRVADSVRVVVAP